MTILTDRRDRQLECDRCPETTPVYDKDDFDIMIAEAKDQGWEISRSSAGWRHLCRSCRSGERLDRAKRLLG